MFDSVASGFHDGLMGSYPAVLTVISLHLHGRHTVGYEPRMEPGAMLPEGFEAVRPIEAYLSVLDVLSFQSTLIPVREHTKKEKKSTKEIHTYGL